MPVSSPLVTTKVTRIALRLFRALRYVTELLVWSRIFVAKRGAADIEIPEAPRARKGVRYPQPHLAVEGRAGAEHFARGFSVIYNVLFANLQPADRVLPYRHARPAPAFIGVYLWDSAFIALIWRHWDREVALDVLHAVVQLRDGDKFQHVVTDFVRSPFTQPPLIGWSAEHICREGADAGTRLASFFAALWDFHRWLNTHRRLPGGLYFWQHPYESGVENAPRFSSRDEKKLADTRHLAAPDLSAYMVLQCEALARMARILGDTAVAEAFEAEACDIRKQINQQLWHEEDGLYYDRHQDTGEFVRSRTIASLIPLVAGVPGPEQAQRLCRMTADASAFGSPMPLPSVALDDPDFARDMWRGPVWLNTAYLVLEGLRRYGFMEEYGGLAWRLCDGVFRVLQEEQQVYEFYDPEYFHTRKLHRKKGNWWKAFTLGSGPQKDFVGWTGLVNSLLIEGLCGLRKTATGLAVQPCFPKQAAGLTFRLCLPQYGCTLHLTVAEAGRFHGELEIAEQRLPFQTTYAETVEFETPPSPAQGV